MNNRASLLQQTLLAAALLLVGASPQAGPVYQPPGANVTFGAVTHEQRALGVSANPAAAAAALAGSNGGSSRGAAVSVMTGLEYGNLDNLFDFYNRLTAGFDPGESGEGSGPGQDPDEKPPGGIDLGQIWDSVDPDVQAAVSRIAAEVATQTALLAIIRNEGYGKAWVSADAPIAMGEGFAGGAWTLGLNWSGAARAGGLVDSIDFDRAAAEQALNDWTSLPPLARPEQILLSDEIALYYDQLTNVVGLGIRNDSSLITKATQTTELAAGYSRLAWSGDAGSLYLGATSRLYLMRLTRLSVRFGDITDSEELFDDIRNGDYRNDTGFGIDVGALWVAGNYQLGAQLTNLNQPEFRFPNVDLGVYQNPDIIDFLQRDTVYRMDSQLRLEASVFGEKRRWSAHLGVDADAATDPLGDEYQWLTVSTSLSTSSRWMPGVRFGYRENLSGTRQRYLGVGLTFFDIVNLDVAAALDTARIEETDLPRGLMASLGFQINW